MSKLTSSIRHTKRSRHGALVVVIQLILATILFNGKISTVNTAVPTDANVNDNDLSTNTIASSDSNSNEASVYEADKRSWQSLQGPWGKRTLEVPWAARRVDGEGNAVAGDDVYFAAQWVPVVFENNEDIDANSKLSLAYLANAIPLDRLTQGQQHLHLPSSMQNIDTVIGSVDDVMNEKRAWKNMNTAWGKRRNAPTWNKFRDFPNTGSWGKREPGWNNLKGMWGKRATRDWQKLNGGWGKRSQDLITLN